MIFSQLTFKKHPDKIHVHVQCHQLLFELGMIVPAYCTLQNRCVNA